MRLRLKNQQVKNEESKSDLDIEFIFENNLLPEFDKVKKFIII